MANQNEAKILANCQSSSEALSKIFALRKKEKSYMSLGWLGKRIGVASKGYLSQVFSGKRKLSQKYQDSMVKALELDQLCSHALMILFALENSKKVEEAQLKKEWQRCLLLLKVRFRVLNHAFISNPLALEIYCALGLLGNKGTCKEVHKLFSFEDSRRIESAISLLAENRLISFDDGCICPLENTVVFDSETSEAANLELIRQGLEHVSQSLDECYRNQDAHFETGMVSVRRDDYLEFLETLKMAIVKAESGLQSEKADHLIRFAVGIYPVIKKH